MRSRSHKSGLKKGKKGLARHEREENVFTMKLEIGQKEDMATKAKKDHRFVVTGSFLFLPVESQDMKAVLKEKLKTSHQ